MTANADYGAGESLALLCEKALRWACWSWADSRHYPEPDCPSPSEFATVSRSFGYEPWASPNDGSAT
jgi:hypothetical protein